MPADRELWAVASHTIERHGRDAPLFVAERIGALAMAGDAAGIEVWREIAGRMAQLMAQAPIGPNA